VRDIAGRLAMSESDLYRKQRVAIAEVARALASLEKDETGPVVEHADRARPVAQEKYLDNQL
jgi:hypothetical protein